MATKTTAQSGNWSNTATWGGSLPADGDAVVVAAGHTLTFNVDLSAWTTGVAGLTITSAAGTPGKLQCTTANGTYVLPIKTGTKIQGTNAAVKGQLYAGSAGTPLPNGAKFTIKLLGTTSGGAQIDRTYLDVQLYCTQPTTRWVKLTADKAAGQTVLSVDTDVTGDLWAAGDIVALCDVDKGVDYQRTTIAAGGITSTTITVNDALDSANVAGAFLVRVTRNIEITAEGSQVAVTGPSSGAVGSCVFNCTLRQTGTQQGYGIIYGYGDTLGGVINGFSSGISGREGCDVSGCVVGNTTGISASYATNMGFTVSGLIAGSTTGIASFLGGSFSGIVAGCTSGLLYGVGASLGGQVIGCAKGVDDCGACDVVGSITGCTWGINYGTGTIKQGAVLGGTGANANSNSDLALFNGYWEGYGAGLRSTVQVGDYLKTNPYAIASAVLYDVADASGVSQLGRMKWWNCGGYGASEDWVLGTHGTPPVPLNYVHKHTFEAGGYDNFVEVPIWGEKDALLTVKVYLRKQQNGMTVTPYARLINPNKPWGDAQEALVTATMADDTNWQTLTLSLVPGHDRQLWLRAGGRNGSGTMYWNFDVHAGCRRRPAARLGGV